MLKEKENNYIASIYAGEDSIGLAYCDVSTGEMNLTTIRGTNQRENLINEIVKINAREVLVSQETDDKIDTEEMKPVTEAYFNIAADEFYRPDAVRDTIKRQFHVSALLGIGVEEDSPAELDRCCCTCLTPRKTAWVISHFSTPILWDSTCLWTRLPSKIWN